MVLSRLERDWIKRLAKKHPRLSRTHLERAARRFAREYGRPPDEAGDVSRAREGECQEGQGAAAKIRGTMTLTEKAAIGAGIWGAKRWFGREVMAEIAKQKSWVPTNKLLAGGVGGAAVLGNILIMIGEKLGIQLNPEQAMTLAAAVVIIVGYFVPDRPNVPVTPAPSGAEGG